MEFLVHIVITVPADLAESELQALKASEAQRASELAELGVLKRLWRPQDGSGAWQNVGLWQARDTEELLSFLATLPLYSMAEIQVTELGIHPNDPVLHGTIGR